MTLFNYGHFKLHSGQVSDFIIDCGGLTADDFEAVALKLRPRLKPFGEVLAIPNGGLGLGMAFRQLRTMGAPGILIVDDVYTTGDSIIKAASQYPTPLVEAAVIFARSIPFSWVHPLFLMTVPSGAYAEPYPK